MNLVLLITALVILLCVWPNILSGKLGVPVLLAFILLGMAFGSDGIVKIDFCNFAAAERIRMAALIFIMFYGGREGGGTGRPAFKPRSCADSRVCWAFCTFCV